VLVKVEGNVGVLVDVCVGEGVVVFVEVDVHV
jgi:hypothetical protein